MITSVSKKNIKQYHMLFIFIEKKKYSYLRVFKIVFKVIFI